MSFGCYPLLTSFVSDEEVQKLKREVADILSSVMALRPHDVVPEGTLYRSDELEHVQHALWQLSDRVAHLAQSPGVDRALWLMAYRDGTRARVMKTIRARTAMSLVEVHYLLENVKEQSFPVLLLDPLEADPARDEAFVQELRGQGATVEWYPRGWRPPAWALRGVQSRPDGP